MPDILTIIRQRRHRHEQTRRGASQRSQRTVMSAGMVASALVVILVLGATLTYASVTQGLPPVEEIPVLLNPLDGQLLQPTRLYDRTGQHLIATLSPTAEQRGYVPYPSIPPSLVNATLALNDPGFWTSPGYTLSGWQDAGSHPTLAQSLVNNLLLWDAPASPLRAIHERLLAAQLTARYGRQQILEWTLNSTDYGHYAYGVEAAAQLYFGKSVTQLDLSEAAMLAGAGQAPALNPLDAPAAAEQRRVMTLMVMQAMGLISQDEAQQAMAEQPTISTSHAQASPDIAPAFVSLVLSQLDSLYGEGRVEERGGLVITTSLDYDLQLQTECTVQAYLAALAGDESTVNAADGSPCTADQLLPSLPAGTSNPGAAASAVVMDPQTGQVLAAVGDLSGSTQASLLGSHPAGTSISPFIYVTGFSRGLNPATLGWDIPNGTPTTGQVYHGPVRLRIALANDYLPPTQTIVSEMGVESVQGIAQPFGLDLPGSLLENDFDISPLNLAAAYSIFATSGTQAGQAISGRGIQPAAVLQVLGVDHSAWVDWIQPKSQSVVSTQLAYLMNQVLSDEAARWPSLGHPNPLEIGRPAGVKLARSLDSSNGWTIGYTPQRTVVVWLATGSGNTSAARSADLWHALMQYAVRDLPPASWEMPTGIVTASVCDPSGMLATTACPNVVSEVFLDGRQPVQLDTLYQTFQVNRETGLLATVFTPPELVEARTYMVVPQQAQAWADSAGIASPPSAYDTLQTPAVLADANITTPAMFSMERGTLEIVGSAGGTDFQSYRLEYGQGLYPKDWYQIGAESSTPVSDDLLGTWDTSGLDGLYALRLMVVHADQRVEEAVVQVTLDNTPPQVAISYPQDGQVINLAQEPKVALQAQVNEPFLAKVDFYVDDVLVGKADVSPYGVIWTARKGTHILHVVAVDQAGNSAETTLTFSVK